MKWLYAFLLTGAACLPHPSLSADFEDLAAIASAPEAVRRDGPKLILAGKEKPVELIDGHCLQSSEDRNCLYRFVRYDAPHQASIVHAFFDTEFDTFLWIRQRDGKITPLPDDPHPSPDGKQFAIVRSCEAMGAFCGLQVWRSDGPELVWEHRPTAYAVYEFDGWRPGGKIDLKLTTWIDHQLRSEAASLTEDGQGKWTIAGPAEKSD